SAKVKMEAATTVKKTTDSITFEGKKGFNVFNLITIDNKNNIVLVDTMKMKFVGVEYVDSASSIYLNGYSGFKWEYEAGNLEQVEKMMESNYTDIELVFAQTFPIGVTLVLLNVKLIVNVKPV